MKRTAIKRKPAKPRARGTACADGRRCIAEYTYHNPRTDKTYRYCPKHMADHIFGDYVKRLEGCCRYCGTPRDLEWAHVMSRRYMATRWLYSTEMQNSMALCRTHHFMFTENPLRREQWCRDVGVDWDALRELALKGRPMDADDVIESLNYEEA